MPKKDVKHDLKQRDMSVNPLMVLKAPKIT
jgi:hypothetical protein